MLLKSRHKKGKFVIHKIQFQFHVPLLIQILFFHLATLDILSPLAYLFPLLEVKEKNLNKIVFFFERKNVNMKNLHLNAKKKRQEASSNLH